MGSGRSSLPLRSRAWSSASELHWNPFYPIRLSAHNRSPISWETMGSQPNTWCRAGRTMSESL